MLKYSACPAGNPFLLSCIVTPIVLGAGSYEIFLIKRRKKLFFSIGPLSGLRGEGQSLGDMSPKKLSFLRPLLSVLI